MAEIIMVAGGSRSGKSSFAESLLKGCKKAAYVATLKTLDKEMEERVNLHRKKRPQTWQTIEEYTDLSSVIDQPEKGTDGLIIDCFTGYLSNLLLEKSKNNENITHKILDEVLQFVENNLIDLMNSSFSKIIVVTNETGCGVIPSFELGRAFADLQGWANQKLAEFSSEVYFLQFGIARKLK